MTYSSWDIEHGRLILVIKKILCHFLPFYPPKNLKKQNFEKMKKMAGDKQSQSYEVQFLRYGDMKWGGQYFLWFWEFFALLPN